MRLTIAVVLAILYISPGGPQDAEAARDLRFMNRLNNVSAVSGADSFTLRLDFQHPLEQYRQPTFYNRSVQIDIPNAYVQPAKRYFSTDHPAIPEIFASQFDPGTLRIRLVLGDDVLDSAENFEVRSDGNFLTVRLINPGNDLLSKFIARAVHKENEQAALLRRQPAAPAGDASAETGSPAYSVKQASLFNAGATREKPVSEAAGRTSTPSPSRANEPTFKKDPTPRFRTDASGEAAEWDPWASGMNMLMMFSLVLGLIFILFFLFKKFVLKNTLFGKGGQLIQVLGSGFIGPKKNIALVEVAGEVLVLGISNDNISLLGNISDPKRIERIKSAGVDGEPGSGVLGKLFGKGAEPKGNPFPAVSHSMNQKFARYLRQFSSSPTPKGESVARVAEQIRQNMGKLKTV